MIVIGFYSCVSHNMTQARARSQQRVEKASSQKPQGPNSAPANLIITPAPSPLLGNAIQKLTPRELYEELHEYRDQVVAGEVVQPTKLAGIQVAQSSMDDVLKRFGQPDHTGDAAEVQALKTDFPDDTYASYSRSKLAFLFSPAGKVDAILIGIQPRPETPPPPTLSAAEFEAYKKTIFTKSRNVIEAELGQPKFQAPTNESKVLNATHPGSDYVFYQEYNVVIIYSDQGLVREVVDAPRHVIDMIRAR